MSKIIQPNVVDGDLQLDGVVFNPPIADTFDRSIAYLYGEDKTNGKFRFLACDENGVLTIDASGAKATDMTLTRPTITSVATLVKSTLSTRKHLIIRNVGSVDCYIAKASGINTATAYILPSGEVLEIENYSGAVYGRTTSADCILSVMEVF